MPKIIEENVQDSDFDNQRSQKTIKKWNKQKPKWAGIKKPKKSKDSSKNSIFLSKLNESQISEADTVQQILNELPDCKNQ